jgi:hypothetical protein
MDGPEVGAQEGYILEEKSIACHSAQRNLGAQPSDICLKIKAFDLGFRCAE